MKLASTVKGSTYPRPTWLRMTSIVVVLLYPSLLNDSFTFLSFIYSALILFIYLFDTRADTESKQTALTAANWTVGL